jgi:biotin carboxyl carrier protein
VKQALGRAAAVAAATSVTAIALWGIGAVVLYGDARIGTPLAATSPAPTIAPAASPQSAVLSDVATPEPTPAPTTAPTPTPVPTAKPLAITPFRSGGRNYVGLVVPDVGTTFAAPFAGTVEVRVYQLIDGEVRVGSNVPSLPFFPYISVVSADKKITFRPGSLGVDSEVLATNGATIKTGEPLFRLIADGRSSWATFYNSSAPYQVVVSLQSATGGRDLDPAGYFTGG